MLDVHKALSKNFVHGLHFANLKWIFFANLKWIWFFNIRIKYYCMGPVLFLQCSRLLSIHFKDVPWRLLQIYSFKFSIWIKLTWKEFIKILSFGSEFVFSSAVRPSIITGMHKQPNWFNTVWKMLCSAVGTLLQMYYKVISGRFLLFT